MEARLVSIDPSSNATGMALFIGGKLKEYKLIDLKENKDSEARLSEMCAAIFFQLNEWNPNVIYAEHPQGGGKNVKIVSMISEILGAIRTWAKVYEASFEELNPSAWRKYCGFPQGKNVKRDELKAYAKEYIFNEHGLNIDSEDVCDAICLGTGVLNNYYSTSLFE